MLTSKGDDLFSLRVNGPWPGATTGDEKGLEQQYSSSDGVEALRLSEHHPHMEIDLLVSDLDMPRMDGNELARQLRHSRSGLKVLIVTGTMAADFPPDLPNCVVDVLPKPVDSKSLLSRIAAVLGT
jgi:CheY-like chemotaxis protein